MRYVLVIMAVIAAVWAVRFLIVKVQARILVAETEYILNEQYNR